MTLFNINVSDPETTGVIDALEPLAHHAPLAIHRAKYLVLAPEETGRMDILGDDVDPEEKSYVGKRIEINFLTAAGLPRGRGLKLPLDTVIAGANVDVKTSLTNKVMIAPKNVGEIILIIHHNPGRDTWALGVVRVRSEYLNQSKNRDKKQTLSKLGQASIHWIEPEQPMPAELRNPLNALPPASAKAILHERSGQAKLNALFSVCLDTPIPRWLVVALGQQLDPAKRVRDSRMRLEGQGIRILSTRYDREELEAIGFNPPESSAFFYSTRRPHPGSLAA